MNQSAHDTVVASHVYTFSRNWSDGKRLCGTCNLKYNDGDHEHVAVLKPYTSYVCPNDTGLGHSSRWSGSQDVPELRGPNDNRCVCGEQFVEEDTEVWRLSWDMKDPWSGNWRPVTRDGSKHSTHQQRDGLLTMPDEVRNVRLMLIAKDSE